MVLAASALIAKIASKTSALQETSSWTPLTGTYDPDTGDVGSHGSAVSGVGCFVGDAYDIGLVDGDYVRSGDLRLIVPVPVAGLTFTPSDKHAVTFRSQAWQVVRVSPIPYRQTVVAYDCQLRR